MKKREKWKFCEFGDDDRYRSLSFSSFLSSTFTFSGCPLAFGNFSPRDGLALPGMLPFFCSRRYSARKTRQNVAKVPRWYHMFNEFHWSCTATSSEVHWSYLKFISLYFIHVSFLFHSCFIHVSSIFHLYFIYISSIFHLYFIYISSIFYLCFIYVSSMFHPCNDISFIFHSYFIHISSIENEGQRKIQPQPLQYPPLLGPGWD